MSDQRMSFEEGLDDAIAKLGGPATEAELPRMPAAQRRRRGARPEDASALAAVTLIDDDGLLRWVYEPPPRRSGRRRALRRAIPSIDGVPIRTIPIQDLPANQVLESIAALDKRMTPKRGLHLWRNGVLEPAPRPKIKAKRVLLFIHGTFSKSDMFFDELTSTPQGKQYLADAVTAYGGAVYAFDHPTLAVSPWINALELEAALADVSGTIDVVCHSRGGLVAAWWLRLSKRNVAHVILVGAPLAGTTLASPAALRQALDHLATAVKGMAIVGSLASTVLPFMTILTGLAEILGKVLQLGADLPLADVAVVSVPGLASQSRVRNNAEMLQLFSAPWPSQPEFHAVVANFKPVETDAGWRFWRRLTHVGDQFKYGAMHLIFQTPNDLVVDTGSMFGPVEGDTAGKDMPALHRLTIDDKYITRFENSPTVHHTNYFRQVETVKAMRVFL